MNDLEVSSYLERIGGTREAPSQRALDRLIHAHLCTVPYENLDILNGVPIRLDTESLFDKVVNMRRGGYCFEVNRLFGELLRALGYDVTDLSARYLRGESKLPMRRHHVLKVACDDGEFLCDVGVGEVLPMEAVPYLTETPFRDSFGGEFFFREDRLLGHVLCEIYKGGTRDVISFTEELWIPDDFAVISYWCEHANASIFNKDIILAIRQEPNCRITLSGNVLHRFCDERLIEEKHLSDEELRQVSAEIFGISPAALPKS